MTAPGSGERARLMIDRIKAVDWRAHNEALARSGSRAALMREYFRRAALWLEVHGEPKWWPFFDLAAVVDPSFRADPALTAEIEEYVDDTAGSAYATDISVAAVHWAALLDTAGHQLPDLPDPFEPLIRVYERGGVFRLENGFIDFGYAMVRRGPWREHLAPTPVVQLDDRVLDELDEAARQSMSRE
ncbi:hypothetical protein OG455_08520 [Kitasatospora sp. NBC_01287]|uniref:hypothetical protein n=1 Tax=Kitasatospora sp. NBC_01287 TaxID=2903573 RepID=UPI00225196B1|nr:hypothetical protein [Kitasatospora sp. NBC_01287]MCX4745566.1 hypothetical protein [Kitasatospora sp. NBC_01287]